MGLRCAIRKGSRHDDVQNAPAPMKLYRARFSPATTDSRRKLYFESFAIRRYATHGVRRSPGSSTYTGTQFPCFSLRMMFSTVERGGNAGSFYEDHTDGQNLLRLCKAPPDLRVHRHRMRSRRRLTGDRGGGRGGGWSYMDSVRSFNTVARRMPAFHESPSYTGKWPSCLD